ncbi:molybdopterin cofactor-binding domain-containing protein [Colwellia sp. UCD-KL20]|uniref:xanthine dehydrogenase family protein molybdopterin-binding subunit n=1 Tax=Colwellia sp. UCD-KL20 TaxID=1917165 RepID=UPI0009712792|nr:molybdopterin cofactor-binding domain-containing protein [Colwellia sp. UCD-KL20]
MGKLKTFTRRSFLIGSTAIAGGVAFGYYQYKQPQNNPLLKFSKLNQSIITPYIKIDQQGVTIITPRAEMGQGIHTTLAALVAEELDLSWETIKVEHGPASSTYHNAAVLEEGLPFASTNNGLMANSIRRLTKIPAKFLGMQITGGSSSIVDAYEKMRLAGATARAVLIEAAAQTLKVDKTTLFTYQGHVISNNGEKISYSELAPTAQKIKPPKDVQLKRKEDWKLLGKSLPRVDMLAKCTGTAEFSIDVNADNLLYATIKMNPNLGAKLITYDDSNAVSMTGVKHVINLNNKGVAVIASNTWYAFQAAKNIKFTWEQASYPASSNEMFEVVKNSFTEEYIDSTLKQEGNVDSVITNIDESFETIIKGEYKVPYLAHTTMEPLNATVLIEQNKIQIWAGNQNPTQIVKEAEKITGFSPQHIIVHTTYMGGGFGRRAEMDFIKYAIEIAQHTKGKPIKVTWSREEDTTHDYYRPLALAKFKGVSTNNTIKALDLQLACPSVLTSQMGRMGIPLAGPDVSIVQAAWEQPYNIEHYQVRGYKVPEMLPISSWRSVGASQNGFFHESVIDELAHSAGIDPLTCRLNLINHSPSKKVIEAVAKMANWHTKRPKTIGLGIAFTLSFGVPVAEIVEVEKTPNGIKILNVYAAVDVGIALDPRNIEAQVMSGIIFGLSAAMMGEITVKDGKVEQTNFHQYNAIRMNQAPNIQVKVLENGEKIRGIGEPGTPPAAPALGNAIFAATGKRIRELPFNKSINFV